MAAATIIPVEEYLRTTYNPDMDYVDGQLIERHVGEWRHSRLQSLLTILLLDREKGAFLTFTEQRVRVSVNPPRYRIPDVCVVALPYAPEPVLTHPPHLVIEIVSPDDQAADLLARVSDYLKAGVPHIWVPDPYRRKLQQADASGLHDCPDLIAETELVGRVEFGQLFGKLDAIER